MKGADRVPAEAPAVSKHLEVLQCAGLVTQGRKAQWRPCRLEPAPLGEAASSVERYRRIWAARYGQLDAYLVELQEEEKNRERYS
jgi:DNA-binding transcriptional ArsR family regulator